MISATGWRAGCCGTAEMERALVSSVFSAWSGLRAAQARQQDSAGEEHILFYAFLGGFLLFVAGLPSLRQQAATIGAENALLIVLSARFFGSMFVLPLLFYGIAALSHVIARIFGGQGSFRVARLALFWAILVAMPATLLVSLASALLATQFALPPFASAALVGLVFLRIWGEGLAEAECFSHGWNVSLFAAVLIGAVAAIARIST